MNCIDISRKLSPDMARHTSQKPFALVFERSYETGQQMMLSHFSMCTHLGTHIDAPVHFVPGGKHSDEIDLDLLMGECDLVQVPEKQVVDADYVKALSLSTARVLFCFTASRLDRAIPYFSEEGVKALYDRGVRTVGTDNFMVDTPDTGSAIHRAMLGREMMIIEGLDFSLLQEEEFHKAYTLFCLPLSFAGAEGAPARAVLVQGRIEA